MNTSALLKAGFATTEVALELFDALAPVEVGEMMGAWKGEGFLTGHPMDGLLEAYHWRGKRFDSPEEVHPLVFSRLNGGVAFLNPVFMGPFLGLMGRVPMPKSPAVGRMFQILMPLLSTTKSKARARMTCYRGKCSATMVYDQLPIHDVFRRIDDNTMLGLMDLKGMSKPFFFILKRD